MVEGCEFFSEVFEIGDAFFDAFGGSDDSAMFPHGFLGFFADCFDFAGEVFGFDKFLVREGESMALFEWFDGFEDLVAKDDGFEQ